jgi:hypothetical protein
VSPEASGSGGEAPYCSRCGESIPSTADYCPGCGSKRPTNTTHTADTDGESDGVADWAIGFVPGSTLRNVLVAIAYVVFYFVGVPLLVYAYWRRGGAYRRRTYGVIGTLAVGLAAIAVVGAVLGPTPGERADTSGVGDTPTPTPAQVSEFGVRISYSGGWQGALSVTGGGSSQSQSISGSGTETIEITGEVDIISVNAQKRDDSRAEITVQILRSGAVVAESSTSSAYGVAQVTESV